MKKTTCFVEDLYAAIVNRELDKHSGIHAKYIFSVMLSAYETLVRIRLIFPDAIDKNLFGISPQNNDKKNVRTENNSANLAIAALTKQLGLPIKDRDWNEIMKVLDMLRAHA